MTTTQQQPEVRTPADIRRAKIIAIVYFVLGAITLLVFALGSEGSTTFGLSRINDAVKLPDLTIPASGLAFVVTAVLAFLGARQWMRGFGSQTNLVLALGMGIFAFSFLAWAASGSEARMRTR